MPRDDTHANEPDVPRTSEERSRDLLIAAGVIAAAAALWAVALGVVDQGPAPAGRYPASPAARVERRPVLFVVRASASESDDADRVAVPIASVDSTGVVRPPFDWSATGEGGRAIAAAFATDYYAGGDPLWLLSGGALAGAMRCVDPAGRAPVALPFARVTSDAAGRADVLTTTGDDDLLAVSDSRYGAATSGARPLRTTHTEAAEQLARAVARERFASAQVESVAVTRVRAADLDHSGTPELLASVTVRMREGRRELVVAMFVIGEPANGTDAYRLAYARWAEDPAVGDAFVFVDQVDLTASSLDEVVLRADVSGASLYSVLERTNSGWFEAVATPPVSAR